MAASAPQSTTTNGPPRARPLRWISSAIMLLPVPVSPSSSTVAPDCASRGSTATMLCIAALLPSMRGPALRGSTAPGASASATNTCMTLLPIWMGTSGAR